MATITLNVPDNIGIDITDLKQRLSVYVQSVVSALKRGNEVSADVTGVAKDSANSLVDYPKIPQNMEISQEIMDLAIGKLPDNVDWDYEIQEMWEEMAR